MTSAPHRCRDCGSVYELALVFPARAAHGPDKSCKSRNWMRIGEWH